MCVCVSARSRAIASLNMCHICVSVWHVPDCVSVHPSVSSLCPCVCFFTLKCPHMHAFRHSVYRRHSVFSTNSHGTRVKHASLVLFRPAPSPPPLPLPSLPSPPLPSPPLPSPVVYREFTTCCKDSAAPLTNIITLVIASSNLLAIAAARLDPRPRPRAYTPVQFGSVQSFYRLGRLEGWGGGRHEGRFSSDPLPVFFFIQETFANSSGMDTRDVCCFMLSIKHFLCRSFGEMVQKRTHLLSLLLSFVLWWWWW